MKHTAPGSLLYYICLCFYFSDLLDQKNTICCIEQIGNTLVFDDDCTNFDLLSGDDDKLKSIALDQDLDFNDCQLYAELSKNASDDEIKETVQAFIDAYCSAIN